MLVQTFFPQDAQGNLLVEVTVTVRNRGTVTPTSAQLYDASGTPITNPFTSSSTGQIEIATANGVYDVRMVKGDRVVSYPDVVWFDPGLYFPSPRLVCVGNSLTLGNQDGTGVAYPELLAEYLGLELIKDAIGGSEAVQISFRGGWTPLRVRFADNSIDSGANTLSHLERVEIATAGGMAGGQAGAPAGQVYDIDGALQLCADVFPLSSASGNTTTDRTVRLCGIVGTLRATASGGPPSTTVTYTFTPASGQTLPAYVPDDSAMVAELGIRKGDIVLAEMGRNGLSRISVNNAQIANFVRFCTQLGANPIILPILNGDYDPAEYINGTRWLEIMEQTLTDIQLYPGITVDIYRMLKTEGLALMGITPTAQDLIDISNDVPAESLRHDQVHLNQYGYTAKAMLLNRELLRRELAPPKYVNI